MMSHIDQGRGRRTTRHCLEQCGTRRANLAKTFKMLPGTVRPILNRLPHPIPEILENEAVSQTYLATKFGRVHIMIKTIVSVLGVAFIMMGLIGFNSPHVIATHLSTAHSV